MDAAGRFQGEQGDYFPAAGQGRGVSARPPDGTVVYAVGDVHGRDDLLEDIIGQIARDAEGRDARRKVAVFLGDYVDRGRDSRQVVERLATLRLPGVDGVFLRGNHEEMMLEALFSPENPCARAHWLVNGGEETLDSYGAGSCEELARTLPAHHRGFLERLALHHREAGYLFVHAGLRPGVPLDEQDPEDLTWIREPFLSHRGSHGLCVVHGHTPEDTPQDLGNRIGVDTGACFSGILTAVALEGERRRFLRARRP